MQTVLIALGGNAIVRPGQRGRYHEQLESIDRTVESMADIIVRGNRVIITHGNGPQVGAIMIQNDAGRDRVPAMPLDVCGSMSQGMLGYMIQQRLSAALGRRGVERSVSTVITQVRVDPADPAFSQPTKPIGSFHSAEEARWRMREMDEHWIDDAGRGWRRVVPSPEPEEIVESAAISSLVADGVVTICVGGGGIPVVDDGDSLRGVEAVIDKDLASERLAAEVGVDVLLILTDVSNVMLNYGEPGQRPLHEVRLAEAEAYEQEGHFGAGSMGPKVAACLRFVRRGGQAVVTSLEGALDALEGRAGTRFIP